MVGHVRRFTVYALAVSQIGLGFCGCREQGVGSSRASGGRGNAATAGSSLSLGELMFEIVRASVAKSPDHATEKVAALDARKADFVGAVDTICPRNTNGGLSAMIDDVIDRVDDGTIPGIARNVASVLDLLLHDPQDPQGLAIQALATLSGSKPPIDSATALKLASRLLAYPDLENLFARIADVVAANDGLAANGQPAAAERDLLSELLGVLSRRLEALERPAAGAQPSAGSNMLVDALLESIELRGGQQVGGAAWAVTLDKHGNPAVAINPATGRVYPPFLDQNADGAADVNAAGNPVDAFGAEIHIPIFEPNAATSSVPRDADGRALAPDGRPLFKYFDAKKTALGQALLMAGEIVRRDVPADLLKTVDALAGRVPRVDADGPYMGFDDTPLVDVAWNGLEVFRYKDAPKLLEGLSALLRRDRRKAEKLLVHLVGALEIARSSTFHAGSSQGSMLDDLVPLLDEAFRAGGTSQAQTSGTARALIRAFNQEQARLRNLPSGFAKMMKYSDPGSQTLVGPGQISMMERLLDMMYEANQCDWTIPFTSIHINLAEVYLEAMAGNYSILGINVSVYTLNRIAFLIPVICSPVQQSNIAALEAFANTGSLEAMIPIAKVFSDRGQTVLLKEIMLALQRRYATDMRPNEPVIVQILESGLVEELFDALNTMSTLTVPSTGENLADVFADFLTALVDRSRGVRNRHGQPVMSLLHLLLEPLDALAQRIDARGLRPDFDRAKNAIIDVALETVWHDNGTPLNVADDYKVLKNHGLIPITAAMLKKASESMSMFPSIRNADITAWQADIVSLMTGRDLPVVVDVLLAIERSGGKVEIHNALTNLFTPNLSARHDLYGSVCELAAAVIQTKADAIAQVDLLHFVGRAIAPSRGLAKAIVTGIMKLLSPSQGSQFLLTLIRNAADKGPQGTAQSPIETIFSIADDIERAGGAVAGSTVTVQDVRADIQALVDFIRDPQTGLEHLWHKISQR